MTKEVYERVDLEIIQFQTDDVITTSIPYFAYTRIKRIEKPASVSAVTEKRI